MGYGRSVLHYTEDELVVSTYDAYVLSVDLLDFLIKRGADIEHRDAKGQTPLVSLFDYIFHYVCHYERSVFDTIIYFLKAGANPNSLDKRGFSALMLHLNFIIYIEENDNTALEESFFVEIVVLLLSYGADDSMNFVAHGDLDREQFVRKYPGAVTCRDVIIRRYGEGVYRLAERERLERKLHEMELVAEI